MKIEGSVALVTGANRGLGRAFVDGLLARGAAMVYAGARIPSAMAGVPAVPVALDITQPSDVAKAAARCTDVTLLINNAGIMLRSPMLADGSAEAMRREMDVNVFGTLDMVRCFAPVLAANGGGAIVNVLSVLSWVTSPALATYSASKHAELAVTDAARIQLKAQGTQVLGVYAGFIDTDMVAGLDGAKTTPVEVVARTLEGVDAGLDHVLAGERAHHVWATRRENPAALEAGMQAAWDAAAAANWRDLHPETP
ncbi:SDR family oxidoreductase [Phenylobacterium sp.]|uniref:SDR family oxidoreductase n=1 Tax=Phenylobacterium sp. TaxID=1871053 RepID=UPI00121F0FB6|nr:SDR family oxidoreductase [Phenylobacterium sp.]THD60591.1 MAG: SDR family NAD(P)-dependent oxidoreductase [Phenylobacterium sp.]